MVLKRKDGERGLIDGDCLSDADWAVRDKGRSGFGLNVAAELISTATCCQ